jgi:hypothetical protein
VVSPDSLFFSPLSVSRGYLFHFISFHFLFFFSFGFSLPFRRRDGGGGWLKLVPRPNPNNRGRAIVAGMQQQLLQQALLMQQVAQQPPVFPGHPHPALLAAPPVTFFPTLPSHPRAFSSLIFFSFLFVSSGSIGVLGAGFIGVASGWDFGAGLLALLEVARR